MKFWNTPENVVKLFGISNELLEADLDRIEKEFQIDLGRIHRKGSDRDEKYYPQFEKGVREEAARMADHYEVFYCLEKSIRKLISDTLRAQEGPNWWATQRIPQIISTEVGKRMQREIDSGLTLRSDDPLDFTTFGELGEIIKNSWDLFGAIFDSPKAVEKVMTSLNHLRGPIAHCSPLAEDEVTRLRLSVRDWFRLME
jgi:hypothetical protein